MAHFIGKQVIVTLKTGRSIEGTVGQVITDSAAPQLILNNAIFKDSGHKFPQWAVSGNDIGDLAFANLPVSLAAPPIPPKPQITSPPSVSIPPVDPAIVSFAKTSQPPPSHTGSSGPAVAQTVRQAARQAYSSVVAGAGQYTIQSPHEADSRTRKVHVTTSVVDEAARLKGPFSATLESQNLKNGRGTGNGAKRHNIEAEQPQPQPQPQPMYQILKREQKPQLGVASVSLPQGDERHLTSVKVKTVEPSDVAGSSPRRARKSKVKGTQVQNTMSSQNSSYKGKGWRQDPMLRDRTQEDMDNQSAMSKSKSKKQKNRRSRGDELLTGWATEDATDIQEMGEFDFEANLANFDKASVFAQLRREDEVPEEERLVSHNKLKPRARPGTFGGTKLHPTENVLDHPSPAILSTSRRGSARQRSMSSETSSQGEDDGSRSGARTSGRLKQRRFPIRTSTSNILKVERSNTDPVISSRLESSVHSLKRPSNPTSSTSNGQFPRMTPSESEGVVNDYAKGTSNGVNFYLEHRNSVCPVITPGGMTALEDLARTEHKYKHQIINEGAGRTLAEIIINDVVAEKIVLSKAPTAIFFVGNHRAGARALVAARHLMSRGFSIVCCVLGLDRPGSQLDVEADKQINMIRHTPGAVVANWREVQKYLMVNEEQGRFADVWIDALVAPGHSYDTLVPEDQNAVREMVAWANRRPPGLRSREIYSIDVPCGINASTGEFTVTEKSSRIQLRSSNIVCMGAPRTGLLIALRNAWITYKADAASERQSSPQVEALLGGSIRVVDIGINEVWKEFGQQLGLATGSGVDFGLQWYITLRLDQENNDEGGWETE
jgi:enhancer of mRNA-decapping protein 3